MCRVVVRDVDWMRNDYVSPIVVGGITYNTVEHAYQAAKVKDKALKEQIAGSDIQTARKLGRTASIRSDWEDVKVDIMEQLVRKKFENQILADRLMKTGSDPILAEGLGSFWGLDSEGNGSDILGDILESVRSSIQLMNGYNFPDDEESKAEDGVPTVREAILYNPDEQLADACQGLYDSLKAVLTTVDSQDMNVDYVVSVTGRSRSVVEKAIADIRTAQNVIKTIDSLLSSTEDDEEDSADCDCDGCDCDDDDDDCCY